MERKDYNKIKDIVDREKFKKQLLIRGFLSAIVIGIILFTSYFVFNKLPNIDFKVEIVILIIIAFVSIILDWIISRINAFIPYSYYNYYVRYRICYFIIYGLSWQYAREKQYPLYLFILLELLYVAEECITGYRNYKAFIWELDYYKKSDQ